jgi:hypothetical protein
MPSRDLADLDEGLRAKWLAIKAAIEEEHRSPAWRLLLTCTYRSPAEQFADYKCGREAHRDTGLWVVTDRARVITNCDGTRLLSNHNHHPARALDFAVVIAGKVTWENTAYQEVGERAEALGLIWGGRWKMHDGPHLELPA